MWKRVQLSLTVWEKRYHVGGQGAHRNSLRAGVDRSLQEGLRAPEQAGPKEARTAQPSAGTMRSGARGSRVQSSGKTRCPRGPGAWKANSRSSERPS